MKKESTSYKISKNLMLNQQQPVLFKWTLSCARGGVSLRVYAEAPVHSLGSPVLHVVMVRAKLMHPSGTEVPSTMEPHGLIAVGPHTTCIAPSSGVRLPVTMGLSNDAHGSLAAPSICVHKDHLPQRTTDVCPCASHNHRRFAGKQAALSFQDVESTSLNE
jgi:hypothetical protein